MEFAIKYFFVHIFPNQLIQPVKIQNQQLREVDRFKYLGSFVPNDDTIDADVTHHIIAGWLKWRKLSGVLCNNRMPVKGKVYKTAVRPGLMYGSKCWPVKKFHTSKYTQLR